MNAPFDTTQRSVYGRKNDFKINKSDIMKSRYDLRMIFPDPVDGSLPSEEEREEYESRMREAVNEAEDRLVEERCDR